MLNVWISWISTFLKSSKGCRHTIHIPKTWGRFLWTGETFAPHCGSRDFKYYLKKCSGSFRIAANAESTSMFLCTASQMYVYNCRTYRIRIGRQQAFEKIHIPAWSGFVASGHLQHAAANYNENSALRNHIYFKPIIVLSLDRVPFFNALA